LTDDVVDVHVLYVEREPPGLQAARFEQIADEAVICFPRRITARAAPSFAGGPLLVEQQLRRGADETERIARSCATTPSTSSPRMAVVRHRDASGARHRYRDARWSAAAGRLRERRVNGGQ